MMSVLCSNSLRNKQNPATPGTLNSTLTQQESLQFFFTSEIKKKKTL